MFVEYLSPLAPAVVLLLSAFILPVVLPRLPAGWFKPWIRQFAAPGLVGAAIFTLLAIRLTVGQNNGSQDPELLSGWDFLAPETVAALTVRVDALSLIFLILVLLILLVLALLLVPGPTPLVDNEPDRIEPASVAGWFVLGASACFLFVAANILTIGYAVLIFDVILAIYWLNQGRNDFGVARLFLGILTVSVFPLAYVAPEAGSVSGVFLLGLALWLRLGLYPFIELTAFSRWKEEQRLTYLGLSLTVGAYLVIRVLREPVPDLLNWFIVGLLLTNGLLGWLAQHRQTVLAHLLMAEVLLFLLVSPLSYWAAVAFNIGLILSFMALTITPQLGQPRLKEGAWFWPYLPAAAASLTLVGFPFSLGWGARIAAYGTVLLLKSLPVILLVILAEALVLSGLVRYWLHLWRGDNSNERRLVLGFVVAVPFLVPGLAPFILTKMTLIKPPPGELGGWFGMTIAMVLVVAGAVALNYFREQLLARSGLAPAALVEIIQLRWLGGYGRRWLGQVGRLILRLIIVIEGQHYLGWAIFAAIVGTLIIILRR